MVTFSKLIYFSLAFLWQCDTADLFNRSTCNFETGSVGWGEDKNLIHSILPMVSGYYTNVINNIVLNICNRYMSNLNYIRY